METVVLLAVLIGAVSADSHHDRRILLHSDTDVAQAIHALKADSVQMHQDLINIQSQNAQLQNNVSNLQINISQLNSHNSQLQGTVTQQQIENSQLRGNVSQLQGTVSRMQSQNSQLQGNVSRLQSQNSQLQGNVSSLQSQNLQLQTTVNHLQSANRGTGSSYVRWGRTTCPANGTTLAYSGYMGGGKYTATGAAVNHLCLTADPIWDHYEEHVESVGKVYGVEYDFGDRHADGAAAFFGSNIYQQDAPCAVCHSPRSAAMMIPGRNRCYPGWTKEYSGYLVSGYPGGQAATEYICLDRRPEALPGGGTNDDENMLCLVEGVCGKSLECPPYIGGRELTCVVCTK